MSFDEMAFDARFLRAAGIDPAVGEDARRVAQFDRNVVERQFRQFHLEQLRNDLATMTARCSLAEERAASAETQVGRLSFAVTLLGLIALPVVSYAVVSFAWRWFRG